MSYIDLIFDRHEVNPERLQADLQAALEAALIGISTAPVSPRLRVHVTDAITQNQRDQVAAIVVAHDPKQLTAAQQAEADRAAKVEALNKPWAQWTAQDQSNFLRVLAEQAGLIPVG